MFTSQSIIQNNSVPSASRGSFNGFTMSISGIGKVVGPAGGAPLLAWSLTNGLPFPLDHTLCYVSATATATICLPSTECLTQTVARWQNLCAAVAALALALVWLMPASMARPCDAAST